MNYLANAFSLGMLDQPEGANLQVRRCTPEDVPESAVSIVGHADTAKLLTSLLHREVSVNRMSTSLVDGDVLWVAQYNGPRLPEGATSLPEGAKIRWLRVTVEATPSTCPYCGGPTQQACCMRQHDNTCY